MNVDAILQNMASQVSSEFFGVSLANFIEEKNKQMARLTTCMAEIVEEYNSDVIPTTEEVIALMKAKGLSGYETFSDGETISSWADITRDFINASIDETFKPALMGIEMSTTEITDRITATIQEGEVLVESVKALSNTATLDVQSSLANLDVAVNRILLNSDASVAGLIVRTREIISKMDDSTMAEKFEALLQYTGMILNPTVTPVGITFPDGVYIGKRRGLMIANEVASKELESGITTIAKVIRDVPNWWEYVQTFFQKANNKLAVLFWNARKTFDKYIGHPLAEAIAPSGKAAEFLRTNNTVHDSTVAGFGYMGRITPDAFNAWIQSCGNDIWTDYFADNSFELLGTQFIKIALPAGYMYCYFEAVDVAPYGYYRCYMSLAPLDWLSATCFLDDYAMQDHLTGTIDDLKMWIDHLTTLSDPEMRLAKKSEGYGKDNKYIPDRTAAIGLAMSKIVNYAYSRLMFYLYQDTVTTNPAAISSFLTDVYHMLHEVHTALTTGLDHTTTECQTAFGRNPILDFPAIGLMTGEGLNNASNRQLAQICAQEAGGNIWINPIITVSSLEEVGGEIQTFLQLMVLYQAAKKDVFYFPYIRTNKLGPHAFYIPTTKEMEDNFITYAKWTSRIIKGVIVAAGVIDVIIGLRNMAIKSLATSATALDDYKADPTLANLVKLKKSLFRAKVLNGLTGGWISGITGSIAGMLSSNFNSANADSADYFKKLDDAIDGLSLGSDSSGTKLDRIITLIRKS